MQPEDRGQVVYEEKDLSLEWKTEGIAGYDEVTAEEPMRVSLNWLADVRTCKVIRNGINFAWAQLNPPE